MVDAGSSTPVRIRIYTAPIISCPANVGVSCDGNLYPPSTGVATAFDQIGTSITPTYQDAQPIYDCNSSSYYIIRTWSATNGCGTTTCQQRIDISTRFVEGGYAFTVTTYFNEALNRTTFRWTVELMVVLQLSQTSCSRFQQPALQAVKFHPG